jgi:hypothetical protein
VSGLACAGGIESTSALTCFACGALIRKVTTRLASTVTSAGGTPDCAGGADDAPASAIMASTRFAAAAALRENRRCGRIRRDYATAAAVGSPGSERSAASADPGGFPTGGPGSEVEHRVVRTDFAS